MNGENVTRVLESNDQELSVLRSKFAGIAVVTIARDDWRSLMESGAIANLKVSRYRGVKQLQAIDLGLDVTEMREIESIVNLGHRLLLPADILGEFNSLETRARQVLRSSGLSTPLGLFVPSKSYETLAATMANYKSRFEALVESLIANLPAHRERMAQEYERLAAQVLARVVASDPSAITWSSRDQWESDFVTRCMLHFPSADTLRSAFSFALSLSFVPLPYESQTETPIYAASSGDLVNLRRAVITEQREAREALVSDFLSSVQGELYGLVNEALSDTLASIKKNDSLSSRSVVQLKRVVAQIGDLNFWGDKRLETIQQEITALLERPSKTRSTTLATMVLDELSYQVRVANMGIESLRNESGITLPASESVVFMPVPLADRGDLLQEITAASAAQGDREALSPQQEQRVQEIMAQLGGVALSVSPASESASLPAVKSNKSTNRLF